MVAKSKKRQQFRTVCTVAEKGRRLNNFLIVKRQPLSLAYGN
ncbi:hypothetical protein HMPREF1548_00794 [Clostridium sp. KLE 1755]|nr:hypothetical protein HMPREF1548_00794 [Clostridium sp. KLE 1755]